MNTQEPEPYELAEKDAPDPPEVDRFHFNRNNGRRNHSDVKSINDSGRFEFFNGRPSVTVFLGNLPDEAIYNPITHSLHNQSHTPYGTNRFALDYLSTNDSDSSQGRE